MFHKYAALLLHGLHDAQSDRSPKKHDWGWLVHSDLLSLGLPDEQSHWREWLGSSRWDECSEPQWMLIVSGSGDSDALDHTNGHLVRTAETLREALMLAGPPGSFSGGTTILTGLCSHLDFPFGLTNIRQFATPRSVTRPFFLSQGDYGDQSMRRFLDGVRDHSTLDWTRVDRLYRVLSAGVPVLLAYGRLAFTHALEAVEAEFRVPDFVRAAESVLGLPRGRKGGAQNFAARAQRLLPPHWFIDEGTVTDQLKKLYEHRNECVHGKVPFLELQSDPDAGLPAVARFEFLAEHLARECLVHGLLRPNSKSVFNDRLSLERAWEDESAFRQRSG